MAQLHNLGSDSEEIAKLRGSLKSRGMQDKKDKIADRVGLLGLDH